MKKLLIISLGALCYCSPKDTSFIEEVDQYLQSYNETYLQLYYPSSEAEWVANTKIVEGDTMNAWNVQQANEALSRFVGSIENIEKVKKYLERKDELDTLQVKQLESVLYRASNAPQTISELISRRIKAENAQTEKLYGFEFILEDKPVTPNDIDKLLIEETDVEKRLKVWESSKEVGKGLKKGLEQLRYLRNQSVQEMGYEDYFSYQVSDYGMTREEMIQLCEQLVKDIWPLYRELHTYTRYTLAEKYEEEVPEMLPAHWLPNRWGQSWDGIIEVEGLDLDAIMEEKGAEWVVRQAERFYVSMGFEALPESFYSKSSLYPLPDDADYKKNNHASAWHMDLKKDVRSLMSVVPNTRWYETTHHELGHIYYFLEYSNPEVPPILREGANRAFHEAIGSMLGMAATQKPFLIELGLVDSAAQTDEIQTLLKQALDNIVFIPFSAGLMTHFEDELYANKLPIDQFNQKWWDLKLKYQGIIPPNERGEEYCDAASKTHINNDAAQYYDYALSYALLFQVHNAIATNILQQDPRATNYYGSKETGAFLHKLLSVGATGDWRELMIEATGEEINAKAMLDYFAPLTGYLKEINEGRVHTLPEIFE